MDTNYIFYICFIRRVRKVVEVSGRYSVHPTTTSHSWAGFMNGNRLQKVRQLGLFPWLSCVSRNYYYYYHDHHHHYCCCYMSSSSPRLFSQPCGFLVGPGCAEVILAGENVTLRAEWTTEVFTRCCIAQNARGLSLTVRCGWKQAVSENGTRSGPEQALGKELVDKAWASWEQRDFFFNFF